MSGSWLEQLDENHELAGFTRRARKVLQLANQEAHRLNHDYVGTEHILLGLTKEDLGVAAQVLQGLNFHLYRARPEVEKITPPNSAHVMSGILQRNPEARKTIVRAIEEQANLKHTQVGTGHVLLALTSESDTRGVQVLLNSDLVLAVVRRNVLGALQSTDWKRAENSTQRVSGMLA